MFIYLLLELLVNKVEDFVEQVTAVVAVLKKLLLGHLGPRPPNPEIAPPPVPVKPVVPPNNLLIPPEPIYAIWRFFEDFIFRGTAPSLSLSVLDVLEDAPPPPEEDFPLRLLIELLPPLFATV